VVELPRHLPPPLSAADVLIAEDAVGVLPELEWPRADVHELWPPVAAHHGITRPRPPSRIHDEDYSITFADLLVGQSDVDDHHF